MLALCVGVDKDHRYGLIQSCWYNAFADGYSFVRKKQSMHVSTVDSCLFFHQQIFATGVYKNNVNGDDTPGVDDFRGRLRDSGNMDFRLHICASSCFGRYCCYRM